MMSNPILTQDQIKKAIEMLFVYNQTYSLRYEPLLIDPNLCAYFNSLENEDWISPISGSGVYYGTLSKKGNKLRISFTGIFTNIWNLLDCLRIEFDQNFYGINTFVAPTIARFYNSLHYKIQNALLLNPSITSIQIIGHSYGTAISQALSVVLYKILLFNKSTISPEGQNSVSAIYSNYLTPYLSRATGANPYDPISKAVQGKILASGGKQQSFLNIIQDIDQDLFANVELESVHSFSPLNVFPDTITNDPDLNLLKSISDLNLGNPNRADFFNISNCYVLPNDPVAGIMSNRTSIGKILGMFSGGDSRILLGQIIGLKSTSWFLPVHDYNNYINSLSKSLINDDSLSIYSYVNVPTFQPMPITVMPYIGISEIKQGSFMGITIGVSMLLIGIGLPIVIIVIVYDIFALFAGWPRIA